MCQCDAIYSTIFTHFAQTYHEIASTVHDDHKIELESVLDPRTPADFDALVGASGVLDARTDSGRFQPRLQLLRIDGVQLLRFGHLQVWTSGFLVVKRLHLSIEVLSHLPTVIDAVDERRRARLDLRLGIIFRTDGFINLRRHVYRFLQLRTIHHGYNSVAILAKSRPRMSFFYHLMFHKCFSTDSKVIGNYQVEF